MEHLNPREYLTYTRFLPIYYLLLVQC